MFLFLLLLLLLLLVVVVVVVVVVVGVGGGGGGGEVQRVQKWTQGHAWDSVVWTFLGALPDVNDVFPPNVQVSDC